MADRYRYFTTERSVGTVLEVIASAPPGAPSATSGVRSVALRSGIYADSVRLMQVSRDVSARDGVTAVLVAMATPLNLELAGSMGLSPDGDTSPEQLLIAIRAQDDDALAAALTAVDAALAERERSTGTATAVPRRTVGAGLDELGPEGPALAIVSVPGQYAVAEAADAIAAGRSVLVFSDGVPVEHEVALKRAAHDAGVLVMGPDCGTAIVSGVALGFANVVRPGPVGLVAASGTGAQQVSCLLDMAGVGVSHVLGVGGRDLSEAVGGLATLDALAALDDDPATERALPISKPPAPPVAAAVEAAAAKLGVPVRSAALSPETPDLTAAVEARARGRPQGVVLRRHARRRGDAAGLAGARQHPVEHPAAPGAGPRHRPVRTRPRGARLRRRRAHRRSRALDDRPDSAASLVPALRAGPCRW
jgi:FdrA protein